jgi:hypothetical protein
VLQLVSVVAPQGRAAHAKRLRDGLTGYTGLGRFRYECAEFGVTTRSERVQLTEDSLGHIWPIAARFEG